MSDQVFWIASRAAGIVCLLAASAGVGLGLVMSGRLGARRTADMRVAHEALALTAIATLVFHAGVLLLDGFMSPSLIDLTIPFASSFERLWLPVGIVSGWALVVLSLSYYVRGRIGVARWRRLHRWTALAWLGGLAHSLGQGTDAGRPWFLASLALVALPALALLAAPRRKVAAP